MRAVYICTVILCVEFIMGILGNGFITLVNCVDWVRRRKISPADRILTALAISRIGMLWSVFTQALTYALHPDLATMWKMMKAMSIPLTVANHFSIWLATSLSIFYFLKIANFSNSVFLYLRWRVKKVVSGILLLSLIPLCLNIILTRTYIDVWVGGSKGNLSFISHVSNSAGFGKLLLVTDTVFAVIPFILSLIAFLLLIFSLWRHLKTMQRSAPGSRDASTTAHVKALQSVVAFLLLYAIFFLSFLIQVWMSVLLDKYLIVLFVFAIELAFPLAHSCVLILGDSRLRQASLLVLWWLRGRSTDAGTPRP